LVEDTWLAKRFGYPVFRIDLDPQKEAAPADNRLDLAPLQKDLRQFRPVFCYVKIGASRVDRVSEFTAIGFRVVETNITFLRKLPLPSGQPSLQDRQFRIEPVILSQHSQVLAVAESCFQYTRFHLDPVIPRRIADEIKREWIQSYLKKERGEVLWIARFGQDLAGFLAFLRQSENRGVVDLIGVAPQYRQRGVARALLQYCFQYCGERSLTVEAGTQAANIPSMHLYEGMGFLAQRSQYILHYHAAVGGADIRCA